ncbi:Dihydrosphingosine 1-phosphate phosphatase YSR3 [Leucoagaricus sp. SymC.cos]|nr:Dihydrosphingosine 1-phosphate phosphatase YSR3 [Leucoagaricus sp. SymC.cos]
MPERTVNDAHFTLSYPPSLASSRASSPTPSLDCNPTLSEFHEKRSSRDKDKNGFDVEELAPGKLPMDVYEATLPWWRAAVRRRLVKTVRWESGVIAEMQEKIRTPWLDAYFVYTSSLGTHTFFMTALPACYFFGYEDLGRGLLMILATGVYCSSVVKDLLCSPRPFSPPVTRLTMGSHHLEYGFPSTHSTNSVSIALFLFAHVYDLAYPSSLAASPSISPTSFTFLATLLGFYTFSIVFGRLYTAMHSFTDCAAGVLLGTAICPVYFLISPTGANIMSTYTIHLGRGLGLDKKLRNWTVGGGWGVPLLLVITCALLVNQHPQPVDDCPCFEDAIAFASVVFGALLGRWITVNSPFNELAQKVVLMPGSGWLWNAATSSWMQVERGWTDVFLWWGTAVLKMTLGIFVIFTWRLLAKTALHIILPPTFRLLARVFQLPNRRFYTPATEYKSVPSEFAQGLGVLHPIPSVIDLPSQVGVGIDNGEGANASAMKDRQGERDVKMRNVNYSSTSNGSGKTTGSVQVKIRVEDEDAKGEPVKHYDADVLTKVIVYAGIAILAEQVLPLTFDLMGLGVKSCIDA